MKIEQIIKTLQDHNDWRRGVGKWDNGEKANYFNTMSAYELGQTIDAAIERLQTLEKERDEARQEVKTIIKMWVPINFRKSFFSLEEGNE